MTFISIRSSAPLYTTTINAAILDGIYHTQGSITILTKRLYRIVLIIHFHYPSVWCHPHSLRRCYIFQFKSLSIWEWHMYVKTRCGPKSNMDRWCIYPSILTNNWHRTRCSQCPRCVHGQPCPHTFCNEFNETPLLFTKLHPANKKLFW